MKKKLLTLLSVASCVVAPTGPESGDVDPGIVGLGVGKADGGEIRFWMLSAVHSGHCLDVQSGEVDPGANTIAYPCHGGDNQQWEVIWAGSDETFFIVDRNSGSCLAIDGQESVSGANVVTEVCVEGETTRWRLEPIRVDGVAQSYAIVEDEGGRCLDVDGAGTAPSTNIMLHDCHEGPNQRWVFERPSPTPTNYGRLVTPLLTLTNPRIDDDVRDTLIEKLAGAVANPGAKILVVRDDAHRNEFSDDPLFIAAVLEDLSKEYSVEFREEPPQGLSYADVEDFDAVWFSNPGQPIDDPATLQTLERYFQLGNGVVLQGDDMGNGTASLTSVEYLDNGAEYCGVPTDNNVGHDMRVTVQYPNWLDSQAQQGPTGLSFLYGDDIDVTRGLGRDEEALAFAELPGRPGCGAIPAIIARGLPLCEDSCIVKPTEDPAVEIGCADTTREGFVDIAAYPTIAGCSGAWSEPGVMDAVPTCKHITGNDGRAPGGEGCSAADLCAPGWDVCESAADVAAASPSGCDGATGPGSPSLFFATGQSGSGWAHCDDVGTDDLFGCGNFGAIPNAGTCAPLSRFSHDLCSTLGAPWSCGTDHGGEAASVVKAESSGGGVLCCRS